MTSFFGATTNLVIGCIPGIEGELGDFDNDNYNDENGDVENKQQQP